MRAARLLEAIAESSTDSIFAKDMDGRYLLYNSEAARQVGRSAADVLGRDDGELFPPETAKRIRRQDLAVVNEERTITYEECLPTQDGERIFLTTKGPLREQDGRIIGLFGISRDITQRKQAEEQLRVAAVAFESRDGMVVTDAKGIIQRVNGAFTEVTGYTAEEVIGNRPAILQSGRHDGAFYRKMWEAIQREGKWRGQIWNRRKDGAIYPEWLSVSAIRDEQGHVSHYFGSFSDISDPKEAERRILELAFYDPLTDLPNRRLLMDRLEQAIFAATRNGQMGALCLLDLDNFKRLNDTRGHDVGDQLLVAVAHRLRCNVRQGDTVARLGGDEFIVLLEDLGKDDLTAAGHAEGVTEKIRSALESPYHLQGREERISTSIGVGLFPSPTERMDDLLKHADLALYAAKEAGRNVTRFYNPEMQAAIDARAALEAGLHQALADEEFALHYQPQVSRDGRVVGAEALLRWHPPGQSRMSPADFIPLAESTGLILPIGQWVLETACRQLALWGADPSARHLQLAVNISPRQFSQPGFVNEMRHMLDRTGADPQRLKLEITEGLVMGEVDTIVQTMHDLKHFGVGFSMDDFGTGYSSLSRLKRLPLDQLKIDQSFVRDVASDPDAEAIVQAIIALCRSLRLQVIAEGVETQTQREFLERHGCDVHQGFLFSPAVPVEDLGRILQRRNAAAVAFDSSGRPC